MQRFAGCTGLIHGGAPAPFHASGTIMATKLEKTIKRELEIDGQPYTVTISPDGVKLTQKGFRKGSEISWRALLASAGGAEVSAPSGTP